MCLAKLTAETFLIADRLEKHNIELMSLMEKIDTTSTIGKMLFRVLDVIAEFEREVIAERIMAVLNHKSDLQEI